MKISIVIPVYNEQEQLAVCLDSIARQITSPYEVIVVDNNSSDNTAEIAVSYPFVKLLKEPKQGVVHARTLGFDTASGDIIGRIDADTILPANWTQVVEEIFKDKSVDAVSGIALYYNTAALALFNSVDLFFRRMLAKRLKSRLYLWGANMAIRKDAWVKTKPYLCAKGGIHEDFDIAIHLQELGGKVTFDERLQAYASSRRIDTGYLSFMQYVLVSPRTYAAHNIKERWHMYWVVFACAAGYGAARVLHRGYNPHSERFSLLWLFTGTPVIAQRVDPTSNVV